MKRKKKQLGIVSVMYIRLDGKLFIQLKSAYTKNHYKYYINHANEFEDGHILIEYHGCLIGGYVVQHTSTGLILDDWSIDRK